MKRQPKWLQALGNTGKGVFVVDGKQRIITWNKEAEKLLGYSEHEVLNRHCYDVIGGRLPSGKLWCCDGCNVQQCVQRGDLVQDLDVMTSTKAGRNVWVNVIIVALPRKVKPLTLHLVRRLGRRERSEEAVGHILRTLSAYGFTREMYKASKKAAGRGQITPAPSNALSALTRRELEVLGLLSRGYSTDGVADRLGISHITVRNHTRNMLRKTGLHSKTEMVSLALRNDLL